MRSGGGAAPTKSHARAAGPDGRRRWREGGRRGGASAGKPRPPRTVQLDRMQRPAHMAPAIIRATLGSARLELGERCKYAVVIIVSSPLGHVPADRDFSSLVGDLNTATAWPRRHLALLRVESGLGHALLSWVVALFNLPIIARNRSFGQMLLSAALRQRITQ